MKKCSQLKTLVFAMILSMSFFLLACTNFTDDSPSVPNTGGIIRDGGGENLGESGSYTNSNGIRTLRIQDGTTLIYPNEYSGRQIDVLVLPQSLLQIYASAFSQNFIQSLVIPDSVTFIGAAAFFFNKLTSLSIPDSVTSIGASAFSSNQLTTLSIPDSVISIGAQAFFFNKLTSLSIPDSVTSIGDYAFSNNSNLNRVNLPSTLYNALENEGKLTTVFRAGVEYYDLAGTRLNP